MITNSSTKAVPPVRLPKSDASEAEKLNMATELVTKDRIFDQQPMSITEFQKVAMSTQDAIKNNADILALMPELKLAFEIIIAFILSPKEFTTWELNFRLKDSRLPLDLSALLTENVKKYVAETYNYRKMLPKLLEACIYVKGAKIFAVIPSNSAKNIIDKTFRSNLTTEEFDSITKHKSILFEDASPASSFTLEEYGLQKYFNSNKGTFTLEDDPLLSFTDNPGLLYLNEKRKKDLANELSSNFTTESYDNMIDTMKIETPSHSTGKPLIIDFPTEACGPIHTTNDPSHHIGYWFLLDTNGGPVSVTDKWFNYDATHGQVIDLGDTIMGRSKSGLETMTGKVHTIKNLEQIYLKLTTERIKKRLKDSKFGFLEPEVENQQDLYKILFSRALAKRQTKILFLPKELVSYYAFDFRENGTGKSLLEGVALLASMRAMLTFSRVTAGVKNSTTNTKISATIEDDDPDPEARIEEIKRQGLLSMIGGTPFGNLAISDLATWSQTAGLYYDIKSKNTADIEMSIDYTSPDYKEPEKETIDDITRSVLMALGMTPEMLDSWKDSELIISVVAGNDIFTKRSATRQEALLDLVTDDIKRRLKFDGDFKSTLRALLIEDNRDLTGVFTPEEKEIYLSLPNEIVKTDFFINVCLNKLEATLPSIEPKKDSGTKEAFNNYVSEVDDYIEIFLSKETMPSWLPGTFGENIDYLKDALRSTALRRWMSDNNYLPELNSMFTLTAEGEINTDMFDETTEYFKNLDMSLQEFLRNTKKIKKSKDKKKVKFEDEQETDTQEEEEL